jgi:hypothetical protein
MDTKPNTIVETSATLPISVRTRPFLFEGDAMNE